MKLPLLLLLLGCQSRTFHEKSGTLSEGNQRPKQYVLLAFDGSKDLSFWKESREFAKQNNVKFTYFASGAYFLKDSRKMIYAVPGLKQGTSAIGFGGTEADILARVDQMNLANSEGHEIASHANGHFDGSKWTAEQWKSEFEQFTDLIYKVKETNQIAKPLETNYKPETLIGFRAPQLGHNPALFEILKQFNFKYDTSKTAPMNYWPKQENSIWNYPLAAFRIPASGKMTLSMDFNFFTVQSKGVSDPANSEKYEEEMFDAYMAYFVNNYTGNRAPIHIGHHFSRWNGGAYWRAMQRFGKMVCNREEVECITYTQLTKNLEEIGAAKIAEYRAGKFPKRGIDADLVKWQNAKLNLNEDMQNIENMSPLELYNEGIRGCTPEAHKE